MLTLTADKYLVAKIYWPVFILILFRFVFVCSKWMQPNLWWNESIKINKMKPNSQMVETKKNRLLFCLFGQRLIHRVWNLNHKQRFNEVITIKFHWLINTHGKLLHTTDYTIFFLKIKSFVYETRSIFSLI